MEKIQGPPANQIPEILVNFNEDPLNNDAKYGKIKINIYNDEELIQQRNSISSSFTSLYKNVLLIFIDTLS